MYLTALNISFDSWISLIWLWYFLVWFCGCCLSWVCWASCVCLWFFTEFGIFEAIIYLNGFLFCALSWSFVSKDYFSPFHKPVSPAFSSCALLSDIFYDYVLSFTDIFHCIWPILGNPIYFFFFLSISQSILFSFTG